MSNKVTTRFPPEILAALERIRDHINEAEKKDSYWWSEVKTSDLIRHAVYRLLLEFPEITGKAIIERMNESSTYRGFDRLHPDSRVLKRLPLKTKKS